MTAQRSTMPDDDELDCRKSSARFTISAGKSLFFIADPRLLLNESAGCIFFTVLLPQVPKTFQCSKWETVLKPTVHHD